MVTEEEKRKQEAAATAAEEAHLVCVAKEKSEEIQPTQECQICKVSLCNNHRDLFHAR